MAELTTGKLPADLLAGALAPSADQRVIQGPGVGLDAAIIEWDGEALVVTSDPITFVGADAGRLAVTVNANDIFAVGARTRLDADHGPRARRCRRR